MLCKVRFGHFWVQFMVKLVVIFILTDEERWRWLGACHSIQQSLSRIFNSYYSQKSQKINFIFISILHERKGRPYHRTSANASFNVISFVSSKLELFTFAPLMCHQQCPDMPPRTRRWSPQSSYWKHNGWMFRNRQWFFVNEKVLLLLHNTLQILKKNRYSATKCLEVSQLYNYYICIYMYM